MHWGAIVLATFVVFAASALRAPVAAQNNDSITIPLNEYKNSGVSGTATLEAVGNGTRVTMELSGDQITGNHPTHIHTGTCANFDPNPTYPLTTVILDDVSDTGLSETTVEGVRLRDLLRGDYVILVHKSPEELTNYFVCGDIKADGGTGGGRNDVAATVKGTPGSDRNNAAATVEGTPQNSRNDVAATVEGTAGADHNNVAVSVDQAPRAGVGSANAGLSRMTWLAALAVVFALCSAALRFKRGAHR